MPIQTRDQVFIYPDGKKEIHITELKTVGKTTLKTLITPIINSEDIIKKVSSLILTGIVNLPKETSTAPLKRPELNIDLRSYSEKTKKKGFFKRLFG